MSKTTKLTLLLITVLTLSAGVGVLVNKYNNREEKFVEEKDTNVSVSPIPAEVVIVGQGKIPGGFPEHIPVFPDSILLESNAADNNYKASWETKEKLSIVIAWYMSSLYDRGWFMSELPKDPMSESLQDFKAANNNGDMFTLSASNENGSTVVSIDMTSTAESTQTVH